MPTLLLELFSEEIPSRMQQAAGEQLERLIKAGFEKAGLSPASCRSRVSPRHLALICEGLLALQPDTREEKRGPKIGAPAAALDGFLKSSGLTLAQCVQRDGYYYATIARKGRAVDEIAAEVCAAALQAFVWPKSMRWGAHAISWVRPLHRIVCLLDDRVVPVVFAHLTASNLTHGHRFLSPSAITITHAQQYEAQLAQAHVIVDFAARRARIAQEIAALAAAANLTVREDAALLDEVTGLVEWPVPLLCEFDREYLDLPPEVLISEMKNHQRYFALYDASGALVNRFITVANMQNADGGALVRQGNARVVRARLADGAFYWVQDRQVKLEDWAAKLRDVVFHAKVGMMDAKVARIETLALRIGEMLRQSQAAAGDSANAPPDDATLRRAAQLCKADLISGMVGEFPELQGIMGRYYARHQGESEAVAQAIYEHYKPQGANDVLPQSTLGAVIAVADKLDSIVSLFAAGEKPTGSKDPLALRRAALGVLRILLDRGWQIDLVALIADQKTLPEITDFFRDRLHSMLRDEGLRADIIEASLATSAGFNPRAIAAHAQALAGFTQSRADAIQAIKRALNILAAEEKKAKTRYQFAAAHAAAYAKPAEQALHDALQQPVVSLDALAQLAAPIDRFFTDVLVTEEGHRDARLALLAGVRERANAIADFSKIEG